jgi:distribution and morphology protein 10
MADPTAFPPPVEPHATHNGDEENESVLKIRVDQSWNVRLLWEGRVKELLVSAGVGLGPSSFSSSAWSANSITAGGGQSVGGGVSGKSYWHGVGVSVSYSS